MSQAGNFISTVLPPGTTVQTISGNTGGPVGPDGSNNINVVGDGVTITIAGNPGTHTLTASVIGGGGGATIFPTDSGSAIESGGVLNIIADTVALGCGSSVAFFGSSDIVQLHVTDVNNNTMIGALAGSATIGNTNIGLGYGAGSAYTSSESNNIVIGNLGVATEDNVIRLGTSGSGTGQQNKTFIAGIVGVTPATADGIPVFIGSNGQLGTVGTGIASSFPTDSGTATPSGGALTIKAGVSTLNAGSSVEFTGSGSTVQLNVTDSNNNTIIGKNSGISGISGTGNVIFGEGSGIALTSGSSNAIIGQGGGTGLTTGGSNIIIGTGSGTSLTTSDSNNTLIGTHGFSGASNYISIAPGANGTRFFHNYPGVNSSTSNGGNIFFGFNAGNTTLSGGVGNAGNIGIGQGALQALTSGARNNVLGVFSLTALTTGINNVAMGQGTGNALVTGNYNTMIGYDAGANYTSSESSNILIGALVSGTLGESNVLRIGNSTGSGTAQINQAFIQGIYGITPGSAIPVYINSSGQLGTVGTAPAAITSITGDTGGAQTGPAITFTGGTTGLSFGGATNTFTTTFAGITANGGTVSLATDATTSTVNIGTGAGAKTVTLGSTNSSSVTAIKYGTGNFSLTSATGNIIAAASAGQVTMPHQPAFYAYLQNTVSNATGDGTFYQIILDTLVYDQNSNVNLSGPPTLFTAPVTGKYHFSFGVGYTGLTSSDTDGRILLITTSQTFQAYRNNYGAIQTGGIIIAEGSIYTSMTAGDTAFIETYVGVSTKTVSIFGDTNAITFFSGVLVC
jgi:hypothetical protein